MATDFRLKEQLPALTKEIVATYDKHKATHHLGHCPLPSYEGVVGILTDLLEILFPGYHKREGLHRGNVEYFVGNLVDRLHDALTKQFARALRHDADPENKCETAEDFEALGQAKAIQFLQQLPKLRAVLATDVEAAYEGDPACKSLAEVIFCYPGLLAISVYRMAHEILQLKVPFVPRMMTEWAHRQTGIDIHPGATIGEYFFIDHGTGVVIGETCEIGQHVKLYQGVTLGALSFATDGEGNLVRGKKRHPTIEDGVVVYANATILGGATTIGEGSIIGSSVWITRSVEAGTTVVLEKPRLKMRGENGQKKTA